jgi:hypothetical protein
MRPWRFRVAVQRHTIAPGTFLLGLTSLTGIFRFDRHAEDSA